MSTWTGIRGILWARAGESETHGRLLLYFPGNTNVLREILYRTLYHQTQETSDFLRALRIFKKNTPVVLHLGDHWGAILWSWAVLMADGLPVLSPHFSNVEEYRRKHIQALPTLLESLICVTRSKLVHMFGEGHNMQLYTIDSLYHHYLSQFRHYSDSPRPG